MTDEMLGAIDDEVPALLDRGRADGAQVGTGARFGHRETVDAFAADGRQQVALALLALAREQDVGRTAHAVVVQRIAGAAQLFLVQRPRDGIEPAATDVRRHVGRIQAGFDRLGLELALQFVTQNARALDLGFVRVQLPLHELPRRLDDQLLFVGETEVHECRCAQRGLDEVRRSRCCRRRGVVDSLRPALSAQCRSICNCRLNCSTCRAAGQSAGLVTALAVKPLMNAMIDSNTCVRSAGGQCADCGQCVARHLR